MFSCDKYLRDRPFTIHTYCKCLQYLQNNKSWNHILNCWALQLQYYDYNIVYVVGKVKNILMPQVDLL